MGDLIERLREWHCNSCPDLQDAWEAADALDAKDAEIERLRSALEQIKDEVAGNFDACAYNIAKDALTIRD